MQVLRSTTVDSVSEDVLLVIFLLLDEDDWFHCKAVCRRWRDIFKRFPWKKLVQRQKIPPGLWNSIVSQLALDDKKMISSDYEAIYRRCKQLDANWRQGKFKKTSIKRLPLFCFAWFSFTLAAELMSYPRDYRGDRDMIVFFDLKSFRPGPNIKIPRHMVVGGITEDFFFMYSKGSIEFFDSKTGQLISEFIEDDGFKLNICRFNGQYLAGWSRKTSTEDKRLRLWKLHSLRERILIKEWHFRNCSLFELYIDDGFLIVCLADRELRAIVTIRIISLQTLEIVRSLCLKSRSCCKRILHTSGLLYLLVKSNPVRVLDVASGIFLSEIPFSWRRNEIQVTENSKYLVIGERPNPTSSKTQVSIYDLQAFKSGKKFSSCFLSSFKIRHSTSLSIPELVVDETRVTLLTHSQIKVCDFAALP